MALQPSPILLALCAVAAAGLSACSRGDGPGSTERHPGERLYQVHCALCHGKTGDGKGAVQFDPPARSFLDGGFSFGNTPLALQRTIANGIGGTSMPGFGKMLTEEEVLALTDFVISLGPPQVTGNLDAAVMVVDDQPLIVRGGLPPIVEGKPEIPRGLMLGQVDGSSYEYDADSVRLLGVRQGAFVRRRDWENRGGDPLEPLGKLVFLSGDGDPDTTWTLLDLFGSQAAMRSRLVATEVSDGKAWIEYDLLDLKGDPFMRLKETAESISLGGWSGFRRHFLSGGRPPGLALELRQPLGDARTVDLGERGRTARVITRLDGSHLVILSTTQLLVDGKPDTYETYDYLFGREANEETLAELAAALD